MALDAFFRVKAKPRQLGATMTWRRVTRIIVGWTLIVSSIGLLSWLFWEYRLMSLNFPEHDIEMTYWFGYLFCSFPIAFIGVVAGIITLTHRWGVQSK